MTDVQAPLLVELSSEGKGLVKSHVGFHMGRWREGRKIRPSETLLRRRFDIKINIIFHWGQLVYGQSLIADRSTAVAAIGKHQLPTLLLLSPSRPRPP